LKPPVIIWECSHFPPASPGLSIALSDLLEPWLPDELRGFSRCLVIGFAVWIMCYIFIVINIQLHIYIYVYSYSLFMVLYTYIYIYIHSTIIVFWLQYTISNTSAKATGFQKTLVMPQSFASSSIEGSSNYDSPNRISME
jgi:hypothetical protein